MLKLSSTCYLGYLPFDFDSSLCFLNAVSCLLQCFHNALWQPTGVTPSMTIHVIIVSIVDLTLAPAQKIEFDMSSAIEITRFM